MNALSESYSDLTTPLLAPEILNCFDALADGRCSLREFSRSVLERCSGDRSAATGVLVLLEECGNVGKLKRYDFRPLQRELQRHNQQAHSQFHEKDASASSWSPGRTTQEMDPTRPVVTASPVASSDETAAGPRPAEGVGPTTTLCGRYVLQEVIGRGGVGTVYRAFDRNRADLPHEQQYIALKVLRDEHARQPEALRALRREFHQAQSLSHPGIVNVFDFDQDGDTYFVTMELLDGEPLSALMRRVVPHNRVRDAAIRILRELGDAIAYAHEHDVVHMDLKPGNVIVTPQGHVRVLDFGLAQTFMAEPWISDAPPVPPAATLTYASCERLVGDLPDVRDDIFSFACLAYELLRGEHPFERRSALDARNEGRKPRRIRSLSRRQWRALRSGLAWAREDRPSNMQELLDALAPQSSTSRRSDPPRFRARRFVAASRLLAALFVLSVALALTWNRLPKDVRQAVGDHAAAMGRTSTQTVEAARTWTAARLATSADDAEHTAAAVAPLTPAVAPQSESASRAVAPPSSEANVPTVESAGVKPVVMDQPPEPAALDLAPSDMGLPAVPSRIGDGPGALEFSSDTFSVSESSSMARLNVRRRGGAAGEISFGWHTVDDSAIAGEDYASETGREVMAAGQTTATLLIPIVADSIAEHTELLDVVIEEPSGARLGSVTRVPVIIVDDD